MTIQSGDFWLAEISFTDGSSSKKRPVLVLWLDRKDAIVAVVTSAISRTLTDIQLQDWQIGGLRVPSTVRLSRLDCLEQSKLLFKLGHISQADALIVQKAWNDHIKLQF